MGWSLFSEVGRGLDRHHQFRRGWQVPFFRFLLGSWARFHEDINSESWLRRDKIGKFWREIGDFLFPHKYRNTTLPSQPTCPGQLGMKTYDFWVLSSSIRDWEKSQEVNSGFKWNISLDIPDQQREVWNFPLINSCETTRYPSPFAVVLGDLQIRLLWMPLIFLSSVSGD